MGVHQHRPRRDLATRLKAVGLVSLLLFANFMIFVPGHSHAVAANMYLFWDPAFGSFPNDWNQVTSIGGTSIVGLFPRGDTVANFNSRGGTGTRPFNPTTGSTGVVSAPIGDTGLGNGGNNGTGDQTTHIHPTPAYTIGADTQPSGGDASNIDIPRFSTLELIEYAPGATGGSGGTPANTLPTLIPAGGIALFDVLPATGFNRYSGTSNVQDGKIVQIGNSTPAQGGNDTITNLITMPATLGVSAGPTDTGKNDFLGTTQHPATSTHTHAVNTPLTQTITSADIPPYIQPLLGQATSAQPTISTNLTAMFDGDPGNGWVVVSNGGGIYNQKFIRPNTTYSAAGGGTATHTTSAIWTTGGPSATLNSSVLLNAGGDLSNSTHTHSITVTGAAISNVPPYFSVVVAQKVSFVLNAYRWYVDAAAAQVTDPWPTGTLDVAQDTQLPAIPAPYKPPRNASVAGTGEQIRLSVQIVVYAQSVAINSTSFHLQYQRTTLGDCLNGTWTDVDPTGGPGSAEWRYGSSTVADSASLSPAGGSNQITPASTVLQVFSKSATGATTPNAAGTGATMEYSWLIQNFSAQTGTQYRFRVIENTGIPLSLYEKVTGGVGGTNECPSLVTSPGTDQQLRHGEFFQDGSDQGFSWSD